MALIKCSDCGAEISDKATACIKCGAPMAAVLSPTSKQGIVTTQQTSKVYKFFQVVGAVAMIVGVASCAGGDASTSAKWWIGGVVVFIAARAAAWWSNG